MRAAYAFAFATVIVMTTVGTASGQSGSCALPPVEYGNIKEDIDAKASFLKTLVGDIAFKGQVYVAKNDMLLRYSSVDQLNLKQYFLFRICLQIMNDTRLGPDEKIKAFRDASDIVLG